MEMEQDGAEPGTVVHEMQAGYMIKDRLLRPAMVGVAKAGAATPEGGRAGLGCPGEPRSP